MLHILLSLFLFSSAYSAEKTKKTDSFSQELKELRTENKTLKKSLSSYKRIKKLKSSNEILKLELDCEKEKVKSCRNLGIYYYENKKQGRGIKIWKIACSSLTDGTSCFYLGRHFQKKRKRKDAIEYFNKACDDDIFVACNNLATLYYKKRKKKLAKKFFKHACENKYYVACENLGMLIENSKDKVSASFWYKKACDNKIETACRSYGEITSEFQRMCAKKIAIGCIVLGSIYQKSKLYDRSKKAFRKGCTLGDAISCSNLGMLQYGLDERENSQKTWEKACLLKDEVSCLNLSMRNEEKFDKLCESGDGPSCYYLAVAYSISQKKKKVLHYLRLAKEMGFEEWGKADNSMSLKEYWNDSEVRKIREAIVKTN